MGLSLSPTTQRLFGIGPANDNVDHNVATNITDEVHMLSISC